MKENACEVGAENECVCVYLGHGARDRNAAQTHALSERKSYDILDAARYSNIGQSEAIVERVERDAGDTVGN